MRQETIHRLNLAAGVVVGVVNNEVALQHVVSINRTKTERLGCLESCLVDELFSIHLYSFHM